MKKRLLAYAVLAFALGCGGGGARSTTEKPQGAAKLWLEAALANQDARAAELCVDDFKDRSASFAALVRERFPAGTEFRWGGSGQEGEEYSWSAVGPEGVVFFKVRQAGAAGYKVSDVSTSW